MKRHLTHFAITVVVLCAFFCNGSALLADGHSTETIEEKVSLTSTEQNASEVISFPDPNFEMTVRESLESRKVTFYEAMWQV